MRLNSIKTKKTKQTKTPTCTYFNFIRRKAEEVLIEVEGAEFLPQEFRQILPAAPRLIGSHLPSIGNLPAGLQQLGSLPRVSALPFASLRGLPVSDQSSVC